MDIQEFLRFLSFLKEPVIVVMAFVIYFLFRHIDKLTGHLMSHTANMERLTSLLNLICQSQMQKRGGD